MGGILAASIIIGMLGRWSTMIWTMAPATTPAPRTLIVAANPEAGAFATIADAVQHARAGDRIEVRATTWEECVSISAESTVGQGIVLEGRAPGSKPVVWRLPRGANDGKPLLRINGVGGVRVRGFTFEGQDRLRELIVLCGSCPGVTVEDAYCTGFLNNAITLQNCSGTEQQPVTLQRLRIVPIRPAASAISLVSAAGEASRAIRVRECRLEGPYQAAVTISGHVADIEFANNRIFNAADGIVYRKTAPASPIGLKLTSNTFARIARVGLHFEAAPPKENSRVELTGNFFSQTARLANIDGFAPEPRGTTAKWIWSAGPVNAGPRFFRLTFEVEDLAIVCAVVDLIADASCTAWLNGEPIGQGRLDRDRHVLAFDVACSIRAGTNVLAVQATGESATAGVLARLIYADAEGEERELVSDTTWRVAAEAPLGWQEPAYKDTQWAHAQVVADYGKGPAAWKSLIWEQIIQDAFGRSHETQVFPEPAQNQRDAASSEGYPLFQAAVRNAPLGMDAANDATFLRPAAEKRGAAAAKQR